MTKPKLWIFAAVIILTLLVLETLLFVVLKHKDNKPADSYVYTNGYSDASNQYSCSRPIKMRIETTSTPGSPTGVSTRQYTPVYPAEATRYCHISGVF